VSNLINLIALASGNARDSQQHRGWRGEQLKRDLTEALNEYLRLIRLSEGAEGDMTWHPKGFN
jgi:hypothetical protein